MVRSHGQVTWYGHMVWSHDLPRPISVHLVKHLVHSHLHCHSHQVVVVGKGILHVSGGADLVGGCGIPFRRESEIENCSMYSLNKHNAELQQADPCTKVMG